MTQQRFIQVAIILSTILLMLSTTLHFAAYFFPVPIKWSTPLFIGVFPLAAFAVINIKQKQLKDPLDLLKKPIDPFLILAMILFIYAWFSGLINMTTLTNGSGTIQNGQYFLDYKGTLVKEISYHDYCHLIMAEVRLSTGHTMAFASVILVLLRELSKK